MQNKLIINTVKRFFYFGIILISAIYTITFNGCSGSEEEIVDEQRIKDSTEVYSNLQKSFAQYKKALSYNENSDDKNANAEFEKSLKSLNEVSYELISKGENYFWKKDYDELSKSIVEDYFTTQSEILENSLVFEFAKRVPVNYDKIEEISADREPMPEGSDVPFIRNSVVDGYIEFFSNTERGKSFIDKSLYRSGKYFPIMRKILKYNNAPEELIYLSVQESGLNPTIVSRAGAVGMWQFMPATGVSYGLGSDGYRDDRRDFEKSTDAAAHLLKDLYKTYDDWYLAFAAYNAGPGRVNKAIRNSGSRDFWSLRGNLPGETKNYVPSILALSFVLRNPAEYGFTNIEFDEQLSFDRVEIKSQMTLQQAAALCETDIETIRDLNTELTNDVVPAYDTPYEMRIPYNSFDKFLANYNKSSDIDKSSNFSPNYAGYEKGNFGSNVTGVQYKVKNYEPADPRLIGTSSGLKLVNHIVTKKESLPGLSIFYGVRPTDIRLWNNLNYGISPETNSKLSIYIPESKYKLMFGKNGQDGNNNSAQEFSKDKSFVDSLNNKNVVNEKKTEDKGEEIKGTNNKIENTNTVPKTEEPQPIASDNTFSSSSNETENTETVNEIVEEYSEEPVSDETETVKNNSEPVEKKSESVNSITENTNKKNKVTKNYTVSEGDNLSKIAGENNVSVADLKEWNSLETDKITIGQKLKIYSGNVKTSVHTVSEGENLTIIANEYGVSVAELKDINQLESDVIFSGQKLKIIDTGNNTSKSNIKTSGEKKTYKVKKGDTLASISNSNNVSIQDVKDWNNLKSDKVMLDQILKLYNANPKVRKKK